jgi:hypothetical protein
MKHTFRTLALLATAATVVGLVAAPAAAERASYRDPADTGGASLNDVRRVTLVHGAERVGVRVAVTDLRRRSAAGPAGLTVRIDTRPDRNGAEFRFTTGMYGGTDYQLMRIRNGRPVGEPLTCPQSVHLDFAEDLVVLRAGDGCLGNPDRVRIGVKVTDLYDGSHPVVDWLGAPRSWTRWVSAG